MKSIEKFLSIRTRIIITILTTTFLLGSVVIAVSSTLLLSSYDTIEHDNIKQDLLRVKAALYNDLSQLETTAVDWGHWDDTYYFIKGSNPGYIDSNLDTSTLVNLEVNFIIYTDIRGRIAYSKAIDLETEEEISDQTTIKQIVSQARLTNHPNSDSLISGIITTSNGLVLVSSSPILDNEEELPNAGSLIMGRYLDEKKQSDFEKLTRLSLEFFTYNSDSLPPDVQITKSDFENGTSVTIQHLPQNILAGYEALYDLDSNPVSVLKIDSSRAVYKNGIKTIIIFVLTTLALILLIALTISLLSEKLLLSRFTKLTKQVGKISDTRDLSIRVDVGRKDEIGRLATLINTLLEGLSQAQKTETDLRAKEKKAIEESAKQLAEIEQFNKMMIGRELRMIELKKENKRIAEELLQIKEGQE